MLAEVNARDPISATDMRRATRTLFGRHGRKAKRLASEVYVEVRESGARGLCGAARRVRAQRSVATALVAGVDRFAWQLRNSV